MGYHFAITCYTIILRKGYGEDDTIIASLYLCIALVRLLFTRSLLLWHEVAVHHPFFQKLGSSLKKEEFSRVTYYL